MFARHHLLPPSLIDELSDGVLLLQNLSIGGRERGYLLFEPVEHSYLLTEALRVDLPRLAFQQRLAACSTASDGGARQVGILMIDVDLFKAFNDHYGHLAGDDALRAVASCLIRSAREPEDLVCRYGGEEFAIVLSDSSIEAAVAVARRVHVLLADAAVPHVRSTVTSVITASIGAASAPVRGDADVTRIVAAVTPGP